MTQMVLISAYPGVELNRLSRELEAKGAYIVEEFHTLRLVACTYGGGIQELRSIEGAAAVGVSERLQFIRE